MENFKTTFKKEPSPTGCMKGLFTPDIAIKVNGKFVGSIDFNDRPPCGDRQIRIRLRLVNNNPPDANGYKPPFEKFLMGYLPKSEDDAKRHVRETLFLLKDRLFYGSPC